LAPNATEISKSIIFTKAVNLKEPGRPVKYGIKKTGYYCVGTTAFSPPDVKYTATVEFRNAYGELAAAQIAKLPFYGGITIVYAVIGTYVELSTLTVILLTGHRFWAFLYVQHRHDICTITPQKYFSKCSQL